MTNMDKNISPSSTTGAASRSRFNFASKSVAGELQVYKCYIFLKNSKRLWYSYLQSLNAIKY